MNWKKISLKNLAGYISSQLKKRGINTILVGGACVTIYSKNHYQSYDLDYITYDEMKKVEKALAELEFFKKQKYFQHKHCPWFIEFVSPPIAIGHEFIQDFNEISTPFGTIKLILPTDSVKDRLASYFHWNDKQALEQAINICLEQKINLKEVKKWAKNETQLDKFQAFQDLLANSKKFKRKHKT